MILVVLLAQAGCDSIPADPPGEPPPSGLHADASETPTVVETTESSASVVLDATASRAGGLSIASYRWFESSVVIASGPTAEVTLSAGVHDLVLLIEDQDGKTDTDSFSITIVGSLPGEYTLTVRIVGQGVTTPEAGSHVLPSGGMVTLQGVPDPGSQFVRWSGDLTSELSLVSVLLDRDKTVTAEFESLSGGSLPTFFLPFGAGQSWTVSQGNLGSVTHQDKYAWDFPMPIGTPLVAAAAGRVIEVRESSLRNPADIQIIDQPANFVSIDHGGGLKSIYAHLDTLAACVSPGQYVVRGQVIGLSGSTGYSTGPHLHYEVLDVGNWSIPTAFWDFAENDGVPDEGDTVTSHNELSSESIFGYIPSTLPVDAFIVNDIELTGKTPPAFFYTINTDYEITGRVLDDMTHVCLAVVEPEDFETVSCDIIEVRDDGTFTIPFVFTDDLIGDYFIGVVGGVGGVEGTVTLAVSITQPEDAVPQPLAVVRPPDDPYVDFLEGGSLVGSDSFTLRETGLTYQWVQVSGPPADIADPTAAQTEFTLPYGTGIERVSFQLVVFDGEKYSLPAQVDYLMEDTFHVSAIGVADEICETVDTCPHLDPPMVSVATKVVTGWIELQNADVGDVLTFTIVDPSAIPVLTGELTITDAPPATSFWRFGWSSLELELLAGQWAGIFKRNGNTEATVAFRVIP